MRVRHAAEREENKRRLDAGEPVLPYLSSCRSRASGSSMSSCVRPANSTCAATSASPEGDVMEFARVAKEEQLPVDIADGIVRVLGLPARFINCNDDAFQKPGASASDSEKTLDTFAQKKAQKYLETTIVRPAARGGDTHMSSAMGQAYKKRTAPPRAARMALVDSTGSGFAVLHGHDLDYELFLEDDEPADGDEASAPVDPIARCMQKLTMRAQQKATESAGAETKRDQVIAGARHRQEWRRRRQSENREEAVRSCRGLPVAPRRPQLLSECARPSRIRHSQADGRDLPRGVRQRRGLRTQPRRSC